MVKIIVAIILFSCIVMFHELGHFLFAKKSDICVQEFALGIGPNLCGIQRGETKYCIKALPLGGCCMMKGEDKDDDDPRAFNNKPAKNRFAVIFGGPFFNFILAFLLALVVIGYGGADPAIVGTITEGGAAYEAGLESGDEIIKLDGSRIYNFREISLYNYLHTKDASVDVTYKRDGKIYQTTVIRKEENGSYLFGLTRAKNQSMGILNTVKYSVLEVRYQIKSTLLSLGYLVTGHASLNDLSGPVGIVSMIGEEYEESIQSGFIVMLMNMLSFGIMLSANLGVMNLLPIPALDGGRLVFIILEMIRGKRISAQTEGLIHAAGLAVLMVFMMVIMANDIRNLFIG